MSKGSRTRSALKRKSEKKRRKDQKAALYRSYAETGRKNNSKNSKKHKQISSIKGSHVTSDCGNVGCKTCYPQYASLPENVGLEKQVRLSLVA